jgi:hypothetical protein
LEQINNRRQEDNDSNNKSDDKHLKRKPSIETIRPVFPIPEKENGIENTEKDKQRQQHILECSHFITPRPAGGA